MIVLDASVLIAHLDPFDTHHDAATGILLAVEPARHLLVHTITLAEVLVGGVKIGKGGEMQADLRAAGVRLTQHDDDEPLRLAEMRTRTGLKLPDCCVLAAALDNRATLATFDRALATAAARLGVSVVP